MGIKQVLTNLMNALEQGHYSQDIDFLGYYDPGDLTKADYWALGVTYIMSVVGYVHSKSRMHISIEESCDKYKHDTQYLKIYRRTNVPSQLEYAVYIESMIVLYCLVF